MKNLVSVMVMGMSLLSTAPAFAAGEISVGELLPSTIQPELGLASADIRVTIAKIIRVAMSLLGIVVVCIILYGGFLWMTAGGNEDQVGQAKSWITSGIIGLAIILSAYGIATFVINQLVAATKG